MQEVEPLVSLNGSCSAHHLGPIAHVGTAIDGLTVMRVEILEAGSKHVAQPVGMVKLVLSVDVGSESEVVAVEIVDAPGICRTHMLLTNMNEILVGHDFLVVVSPIVNSKNAFNGELRQWLVEQGVRSLEMFGRLAIVLQSLGFVHKGTHLLKRFIIGSIVVGRISMLMTFGIGKLKTAGSTALREPQSRIETLIAIAAAVIIIGHEAK